MEWKILTLHEQWEVQEKKRREKEKKRQEDKSIARNVEGRKVTSVHILCRLTNSQWH